MSKTNPNTEHEFKAQSYFRLLRFVRPYWFRLTVGILSGMLVGGSLYVALMMVPQLMGVVEAEKTAKSSITAKGSKNSNKILAVMKDTKLSQDEKINKVNEILNPKDNDPQLTKLIEKAKDTLDHLRIPCEIEGKTVHISWPVKFSFNIVSENGRVAWQVFAIYAIIFVIAWLFKNIAKYINSYCTRWVGIKVVSDLRELIFQNLTRQSLSFYSSQDIGKLISRCTNDTQALDDSVSHAVEELTCAPIQIIACIIAIFMACKEHNSYGLAFILLIGIPILIMPLHTLGRAIRKLYRKSYAKIAVVFSRMHETFSCIRAVKSYHTELYENNRFITTNKSYIKQAFRAMRLQLLLSPVMEFVAVSGTVVFLVYAYGNGTTITQLTALLAPAFMAYRPIKDVAKVFSSIQRSMAAADRFFDLLDTDTSIPEKENAICLKEFKDSIKVENVVFKYEDKNIINNISFELPRGHVVAVVGETGSGKSTIANLIARFYDVTSGRITIDGNDLRDCNIASLRNLIGVVNQDPIIFNETIAANISYGSPNATMDDIIAAAKLANAHEFIISGRHPEGYETIAGEKGFRLSGGEKQRIAIARAILRNPPILILDEATSALDTVTEKLVQEALNRVMSNRTVFAIAHRLSTIKNANLIMVLNQGSIVEAGTHEELLALNGVYRKLHDTQFDK